MIEFKPHTDDDDSSEILSDEKVSELVQILRNNLESYDSGSKQAITTLLKAVSSSDKIQLKKVSNAIKIYDFDAALKELNRRYKLGE